MRKIFLDELPKKYGFGASENELVIDWKNSIGYKVKFIYDNTEGEIEIISYARENQKLTVKYLDNPQYEIKTGSLIRCQLGKLIQAYTYDFIYDIGQKIEDSNRSLTIIDRKRMKNSNGDNIRHYKYKCNRCGFDCGKHYNLKDEEYKDELWINEYNLKKEKGCSCCANQIAVLGINTIWDTDRWMIDLGITIEDAKKYTHGSNKKIGVICEKCGNKKNISISDMFIDKSISCTCGDGLSYPEKFMISVLNQLNIDFTPQLNKTTFKWCDKYRYDFYLPRYNAIIETHGMQHYKEKCPNSKFTSLKEQESIDKFKETLALCNGINKYIIIDCRYSELEWIKTNIQNSELVNILDLSNIDWLRCEKSALPNLIKEVCDYWNNKEEWENTRTIAENNPWGIKCKTTISNYLKKGAKLGWTNYNPKEEYLKGVKMLNKTGKEVQISKDGVLLDVFKSCAELARQSEERFGILMTTSGISKSCKENKKYKGFKIEYIKINNK